MTEEYIEDLSRYADGITAQAVIENNEDFIREQIINQEKSLESIDYRKINLTSLGNFL